MPMHVFTGQFGDFLDIMSGTLGDMNDLCADEGPSAEALLSAVGNSSLPSEVRKHAQQELIKKDPALLAQGMSDAEAVIRRSHEGRAGMLEDQVRELTELVGALSAKLTEAIEERDCSDEGNKRLDQFNDHLIEDSQDLQTRINDTNTLLQRRDQEAAKHFAEIQALNVIKTQIGNFAEREPGKGPENRNGRAALELVDSLAEQLLPAEDTVESEID